MPLSLPDLIQLRCNLQTAVVVVLVNIKIPYIENDEVFQCFNTFSIHHISVLSLFWDRQFYILLVIV
ncbi:hypothetical protein EB796_019989 [Bugula neritina]|uniref:Uncharacterized protein n=1 Tax=Bugula neritina TaxID=10212 RepID=A0A7J7J6D5_BUGNE|nr:hypothetical protein EB796_019989 [Bugula neritina]